MSDQGASQSGVKPYAPGAVAALVLGIISIVFGCFAIGLITGIIGLVMSVKAKKANEAEPTKYQGGGMITAGLVLSIIGLVLGAISIIYWIFFVFLVGAGVSSGSWMRGIQ